MKIPDLNFTKEQNSVWTTLFANQVGNTKKFACKEYLTGFDILNLPKDKIPHLDYLNEKITPRTGWQTTRTNIRYSDALPWYQHFAIQEFIVTNYLRNREELNFTPEPDMFHDIFGHLAFITNPEYVELFSMFSKAYLKATPEEQKNIGRLAWFSYEFGMIKEGNDIKIFGAGILSSVGETVNVMQGKTKLTPFIIENVLRRNKAITDFNKELFVFKSIKELKKELNRYLEPIAKRNIKTIGKINIEDKEMDLTKY